MFIYNTITGQWSKLTKNPCKRYVRIREELTGSKSVVIKTKRSDKPPLSPPRVQKLLGKFSFLHARATAVKPVGYKEIKL
jgi:hypothetical protein